MLLTGPKKLFSSSNEALFTNTLAVFFIWQMRLRRIDIFPKPLKRLNNLNFLEYTVQ